MNVFVHGAAGAAAGSLTGSPVEALPAGLASHVPLDVVPHHDFEDVRLDAALQGLLAAVAVAVMFAACCWHGAPPAWRAAGIMRKDSPS